MKIVINGTESNFDEVEIIEDIGEIAKQFTLLEKSKSKNFNQGDYVEIYNNNNKLLIKGQIEYIEAIATEKDSSFVYAGRNNAKYIVDCFMDTTIQFTQGQTIKSVLGKIATSFKLQIKGDAELPKQDLKTILIGENIGKAFVELTQNAGKIITSDEQGNLIIDFEAQNNGDISLTYGNNITSRTFIDNQTKVYDKYTAVSQSNYLVEQNQDVFIKGIFGSGLKNKTLLFQSPLNVKECEKLAEIEKKRDIRSSFIYIATLSNIDIKLNHIYSIEDDTIGLNESMNCRAIQYIFTSSKNEVVATFERITK